MSAFNKPSPQKAPDVPYRNEAGGNPVIGGILLAVLSKVISYSSFLQSILWKLNKFDDLRSIPDLHLYNPRYDPSVVPILPDDSTTLAIADLPRPRPRRDSTQYYTCADYHELYKSGKLTPLDVVEYILPLIRRGSGKPSRYAVAYLETREDLVRAAARASTERYKSGRPLSLLDGVPVAVKDEVDVKGYKRCLGSLIDHTNPKDQTSWCVQKWEDAGAIVLGKTTMHEYGMDTSNNNPNFGTPLNPHNEGYYTGGSSGGSACTVAQGLCPIALGVDGGGSIRLPSSFCGIWGLKPTHNRVSSRPTKNGAYSLSVAGPMCSSIDDLAIAYRVMAQTDKEESTNAQFPSSLNTALIQAGQQYKKIIGVDRTWVARSDPEVFEMFNAAIKFYSEVKGYEVVDITIPLLPEHQKALALTIINEVAVDMSPDEIAKLSHPNQILMNVVGKHATTQHFLAAQQLRDCGMKHLAWLWEQFPGMLIISPTTPCAGWKIKNPSDITSGYGVSDGDMSLRTMEYTAFGNWTGVPAISCPLGYASGNVPVGLMAMGEWGTEEQLLTFGKDAEDFLGTRGTQRPLQEGIWVDVLQHAAAR